MPRVGFTPIVGARYQEKLLTANTGTNADIASLRFNNLIIGKSYKIFVNAVIQVPAIQANPSNSTMDVYAVHDGVTVCSSRAFASSGGSGTTYILTQGTYTSEGVFVATATTVTIGALISTGSPTLLGNNTKTLTWARLQEIDSTEVTTAYA